MKKTNEHALMIFAKAPVPGLAKTRMIPALGKAGAADLQRELTLHAVRETLSPNQWDTQLWCAPDMTHPLFEHIRVQHDLELFTQVGKDLGKRMHYAFSVVLARHPYAVVMGTDCPALNAATIRQSFAALVAGYDAVVVPAEDGGYVLLGMRTPDARVFKNIDWGSGRVIAQTRKRFRELKWNVLELETLWDVDVPEDLDRYQRFKGQSGFSDRIAANI